MDTTQRQLERLSSATLRALGESPHAEYHSPVLTVDQRPVPVTAPYLLVDLSDADQDRHRGVADALAVRLRYSDAALHRELEPEDVIARLVFDMLEQIRCESVVPQTFAGVRANIESAFRQWCAQEELSNSALGLLLYTVLHMARSRLVHQLQNELIEDTLEATRANISPIIGPALKGLKEHRFDQRAYAAPALSMANSIAEMVSEREVVEAQSSSSTVSPLIIPPEWEEEVYDEEGEGQPQPTPEDRINDRDLDDVGGYHVYDRSGDIEFHASTLYPDMQSTLRGRLDEAIQAQSVSVFAIARRLQRILHGLQADGWSRGEDVGVLDSGRLSQLVANPLNHDVFRRERFRRTSPAVVTFLIDNSGSMKRQKYEAMTILVDTLARALDLAGATSEILGFTTASWNGGEARNKWRRAGEPENPGRLAETSHIVYKDADTSWKRARRPIATMLKPRHFREGIDGEAIVWAYRRLLARDEPLKLLIVVSDGAPLDAATKRANGEAFLEAHLDAVTSHIERDPRVQLGAIAIDQPVDMFFDRSVDIDLDGTLTLASYRLLETLFSP